eukprot:Gregarina_sp_Pseudo_9__4310@NODE_446_length_2815_cov_13_154539_g422_i0_p3_GENE_NODE_446_length_2815_cov_13_154539_g422_i0NODE_446_length_2815_cov_13_154539_g422_i0_p3_ORF_typecomplete_len105_score14_35_NODE_446_length_2815_cov_13_154539_g422_i022362550
MQSSNFNCFSAQTLHQLLRPLQGRRSVKRRQQWKTSATERNHGMSSKRATSVIQKDTHTHNTYAYTHTHTHTRTHRFRLMNRWIDEWMMMTRGKASRKHTGQCE